MEIMQATLPPSNQSKRPPMRTVVPLLGCALISACTASSSEVGPPNDELYFPTGMALSPDNSVAFVVNANSELRYNSGSISVFDLNLIDTFVDDWTKRQAIDDSGCTQDLDHRETLTCSNEGVFMLAGAGARIGNFATDIAVQDLRDGVGGLRVIVPTRGDPSIAWADWNGTALSCSSSGHAGAICDDDHRLSYVHSDADVSAIPEEPFSVFADSAGEYAMVTHLTTGAVTLVDSPRVGKVEIADVVAGVFAADPSTGLRGATGVAGRTPNAGGDIVYVGSRSEDRIQTFTVGRPVNDAPPFLLPGNYFFLDAVGGNSGSSNDTRGMAFSPTGDRLYLVNRRPPSVQIYDTSIGDTGLPRNKALAATDICRQGSTIAVADPGDGERAFVTCFQDGQVYVVDPRGQSTVEDIVVVGRGPYAITASALHKKVYITNFLEDTIAVLDIAPGSPTRNRVVLRIGEPRPL